jgi:hypothetical protein
MVQFPHKGQQPKFLFDQFLISMATIGGMFGGRNPTAKFSVDSYTMKIETLTPTQKYSPIGNSIVTLSKIRNPSYVDSFDEFVIQILDKSKSLIAQSAHRPFTYTTQSGKVENIKMSASEKHVESVT